MYNGLLTGMLWLYQVTGNLGWVIIIASILTKVILLPISIHSSAVQRKMQSLQWKIKKLKEEHKDDFMTFSQKQMALYQENGIDMKGTYLPMIVQIVVFSLLYKIFQDFSAGPIMGVDINALFFGVDLRVKAETWVLPAVSALTQAVLMILMMPGTTHRDIVPNEQTKKGKKIALVNKEEEEAMMMGMMTQSYTIILLPIMIYFFSRSFPAGLVLYWIASNAVMIVQMLAQFGPGGAVTFARALQNSFQSLRTKQK